MQGMYSVIVFHKNLGQYPKDWITKFAGSILNQTFQDFQIMELNYGGGDERIFACSDFDSIEMANHAEAMNYLIEKSFRLGYTHVFNTNVDDWYTLDRFEKQILYKADVVSSNFSLVDEFTGEVYYTHKFDKLHIQRELRSGHNVICHPVVMISKDWWKPYNPEDIPFEDLRAWQRGGDFVILPDVLCFHRVHRKSVGHGG